MTDHYALARCKGMAAELFFPARHDVVPPEAAEACGRCCVRAWCLELALAVSEHSDSGVYGGTSLQERNRIRRRRRKGAA